MYPLQHGIKTLNYYDDDCISEEHLYIDRPSLKQSGSF